MATIPVMLRRRAPVACTVWLVAWSACGSSGSDGPAGPSDAAAAVVTYETVKPLFMKKCVPCHLPGGVGAVLHTLPDSYSTANKPSSSCPNKSVGECTIVLVKSGYMPYERNCTGDPAKDVANAACLTAAEQKLLEDWIAGGLKEK
jgi:hypothetical protein